MVDIVHSNRNQRNYSGWLAYFKENDGRRLQIDFSGERDMPEWERRLIFPSIRAFQKGEGSDGAYLLRAADSFARRCGVPAYSITMRLFVREENCHSAYLREFMKHYGVRPIRKSFLDACFRRLRRLGGIRCEVTVLVTAEMIALTYYDALAACTSSPALKRICAQMLHDELPHVMFQSYTLSHFSNGRLARLLRRAFMAAALLAVWCAFHRVYLAGGYSLRRYWAENMGYLEQSLFLSDRKNRLSGK